MVFCKTNFERMETEDRGAKNTNQFESKRSVCADKAVLGTVQVETPAPGGP
jgi:hypothetical protein